jgi:glycosyltransferase involved in cell wall biosynthesis
MAAGRPFIAPVEEDSHVAEIISQYRCGVRVDPDSPDQLKEAILWAMNNRDAIQEMGQRGRQAAERYFDRKVSVAKFRAMLDELGAAAQSPTVEPMIRAGKAGIGS